MAGAILGPSKLRILCATLIKSTFSRKIQTVVFTKRHVSVFAPKKHDEAAQTDASRQVTLCWARRACLRRFRDVSKESTLGQ
jgi:hypothetical protein